MIYIEAPNRPSVGNIPSIFLAGAITGAPDWQSTIVKLLNSLDLVIYNPRRKNFPITDPSAAQKQITWEFDMLRKSSMLQFWFSKETMGPIVLFELGAHLMTQKPIVIGMDPQYQRRQDVEIQTSLVRPDIKIVYDLKKLADNIAVLYNQIKMVF